MTKQTSTIIFLLLLFFNFACEREFIPDVEISEPDIVVEGFIEAGDASLPPYVLLTRSIPFFKQIDAGQISDLFVHDAIVTIEMEQSRLTYKKFVGMTLTRIRKNYCWIS